MKSATKSKGVLVYKLFVGVMVWPVLMATLIKNWKVRYDLKVNVTLICSVDDLIWVATHHLVYLDMFTFYFSDKVLLDTLAVLYYVPCDNNIDNGHKRRSILASRIWTDTRFRESGNNLCDNGHPAQSICKGPASISSFSHLSYNALSGLVC